MEIGISTWSLHREFDSGAVDSLSFPGICAEKFGIRILEYVENHLGSLEDDHLKKLNETLRKTGCRMAAVAANNDFSMVSDEEREKQVEQTKRVLEVAATLGAGAIRVNAGGRSIVDAAEGRVVKAVKECVPKAKAVGVKMGLENHGGFSSNVDAVERMVKAVGSEFFGTCPDWGNFPVDDRYPALAKVYALAVHSHVKSYNFDEKGFETRLDFARIVKIIKDSGYDGILSIEFEGTGDGYDGVTKTQALLKRYL